MLSFLYTLKLRAYMLSEPKVWLYVNEASIFSLIYGVWEPSAWFVVCYARTLSFIWPWLKLRAQNHLLQLGIRVEVQWHCDFLSEWHWNLLQHFIKRCSFKIKCEIRCVWIQFSFTCIFFSKDARQLWRISKSPKDTLRENKFLLPKLTN